MIRKRFCFHFESTVNMAYIIIAYILDVTNKGVEGMFVELTHFRCHMESICMSMRNVRT